MALEIERRFLVSGDSWKTFVSNAHTLKQAYLASCINGLIVRLRIIDAELAWLTLKAPAEGISTYEFEYPIPLADAESIWALTQERIAKTRFELSLPGGKWVVDCFGGRNAPLVLAEVELSSIDAPIDVPSWCWKEVT